MEGLFFTQKDERVSDGTAVVAGPMKSIKRAELKGGCHPRFVRSTTAFPSRYPHASVGVTAFPYAVRPALKSPAARDAEGRYR